MKIKTYKIILKEEKDGSLKFTREINGFNKFELLGLLKIVQKEILESVSDNIKNQDKS